jgi:hypothetical protein
MRHASFDIYSNRAIITERHLSLQRLSTTKKNRDSEQRSAP